MFLMNLMAVTLENSFREHKTLAEKKKFVRKLGRKQFRTQFAIRRKKKAAMANDKKKHLYVNWLRGDDGEDDDFF